MIMRGVSGVNEDQILAEDDGGLIKVFMVFVQVGDAKITFGFISVKSGKET